MKSLGNCDEHWIFYRLYYKSSNYEKQINEKRIVTFKAAQCKET